MIKNIVDFFKNLPAKTCATCAEEIVEQHESYNTKCDKCNLS